MNPVGGCKGGNCVRRVAALLDAVSDLDDLVLQFDGTEAGRLFNEAWQGARIIVDSGSGYSSPAVTPAPSPNP